MTECGIEGHVIETVIRHLEHLASVGGFDIFNVSGELDTSDMNKLLELWYRKWYSMTFPSRPQENWRKPVDFGQENWP